MGSTLAWLVAVAATLVILPAFILACAIWRKVSRVRSGARALPFALKRGPPVYHNSPLHYLHSHTRMPT